MLVPAAGATASVSSHPCQITQPERDTGRRRTGSGLLGAANGIADGQGHRRSSGAQADLRIGPQRGATSPTSGLLLVVRVQFALGHSIGSLEQAARVVGLDRVRGA